MPRSTFYYTLSQLKPTDKYADLKKNVVNWFKDSHEIYDYRRIFLLAQQASYPYYMETIRKIMHQELGLCPTVYNQHRRNYSSYHGNVGKVAPNLLNQHFDTTETYRVLHTDITQIRMRNGIFGYISAVLDEGSHEILSIQTSSHPDAKLILDTLAQLPTFDNSATPVLIHSDQGWHYQLAYYRNELKQHQSMSRKGNCHDNAPMESFFNLLKGNGLNEQKSKILINYNKKLRNMLGGTTLNEFRLN